MLPTLELVLLVCLTLYRKIQVKNTKTGDILEDDADILITARGNFNDIAWPDIPGLDKFQGEIMHSAAWNQELAFWMDNYI